MSTKTSYIIVLLMLLLASVVITVEFLVWISDKYGALGMYFVPVTIALYITAAYYGCAAYCKKFFHVTR